MGETMMDGADRCRACGSLEDVQKWGIDGREPYFPVCGKCRRFYAVWLPQTADAVTRALDGLEVDRIEKEMNKTVNAGPQLPPDAQGQTR